MKLFNHKKNTSHFSNAEIKEHEQQYINFYSGTTGGAIKMLAKLYKGHYLKLFISTIFYAIKDCPTWIIPIITANVINIATTKPENSVRLYIYNFAFVIIALLLNIPFHMLHVKYLSLSRRNVEASLRGAMVRKLQQLSITFHKEMQSGRIQSKIMRDVEAVETLSSQVFATLLGIFLNMVIALSVIVSKNIVIFGFFILCVPAAAVMSFSFRKTMSKNNSEFRKEIEHTSADVMDMVELIPVTRAHALENKEVNRLTKRLNNVAEKGYKLDIVQSLFASSTWVVFNIFQIICLFTTSIMAFKGKIMVGDIALYQTYFTSLVGQVSALLGLLPTLAKGTESLKSIGEILSAHDIEDNTGKTKLKDLKGEYEFKNVHFAYDVKHPILNGMNLKVKQGETIALVGGSGAGKSTVLNMVIGFYKATYGSITIDGEDIKNIDLRSYRKHIAVVPQNSILFSGTIKDNITYGLGKVSKERLNAALKAANLESFIASLPDGLNTIVGEHGGKLSGGQRQRISIARAIIRDPKVIIFDEATSALDTISEREIQNAINNLTKDRTTFIVAHRLSTIRDADKIAVLKDGVCVEYGTFDELMALKGEFYELRSTQL